MKLKLSKGAVAEQGVSAGDDWIIVPRERLRDVVAELRGQGYNQLCFASCVDHLGTPVQPPPPGRYELIYQLRRMAPFQELRVRCFLPEDDPTAPTICDIYPAAHWDERETYDMFGITFTDHPDLTRLLMPEDWEGHPLRRDYPVGGEPVTFSEETETWQTAPPQA